MQKLPSQISVIAVLFVFVGYQEHLTSSSPRNSIASIWQPLNQTSVALMQDLIQTISLQTSGLSVNEMLGLSIIVLTASVIRGYSGFGFSAIVVAAASLFLPTQEVVPLVLLLEVVASLQMATRVWQQVNWRMVLSILAASVLFIPIGQYVLLWVQIELMRVIAAILMLTAVILIATGRSFLVKNDAKGWFLIGTVSGFMNGLLAMGGMWAMIFLLGSGINITTIRASLVALFFTTDSYAVLTGLGQGLMNSTILVRSIWVLPSLFLGVWIGSRKFESSNADIYKKVVLWVLAALAVMLLFKAFFASIKL